MLSPISVAAVTSQIAEWLWAPVRRPTRVRRRTAALAFVGGLVVVSGAALYFGSGRGDPDAVSNRVVRTPASAIDQLERLNAAQTQEVPAPITAQAPTLGSVDEMIQRLIDRLDKDPANVETWRMLGWSYAATERYPQAVSAYRKATALQPDNATLLTSFGEVLVLAAGGTIPPEAVVAFDAALAAEPREPRARYFKGLEQERAGNKRAALDIWTSVLSDADPEAGWTAELRSRVGELARDFGLGDGVTSEASK